MPSIKFAGGHTSNLTLLECPKVTANWVDSTLDGRLSSSRTTAIFFLVFAGLIEGLGTVLAGGPVAQSPGELRTYGLICCLLCGLLGVSYWAVVRPSFKFGSRLEWLLFLVPVYAFCQVLPLPLSLVRVLSPERARLADALQPIATVPRWIPISATPSATLYHCLLFFACSSVFLVVYDLSERFSRRPWIVTLPLIVVGAAQALIGLVQASASPDGIAKGTYAIRNHYAGLLEMILPFSAVLAFAVAGSWKPKTDRPGRLDGIAKILLFCAGIALTALLSAAIISSLSRMGFVASLASMVFIAVIELVRRSPAHKMPWAAVTVVSATVLLIFLLPSARLIARFGEIEQYGNGRTPAWYDTLRLIEAYPVVGCGLGAYESSFLEFKNSAPTSTQDYAHNDYLQYLAEMGAVGFAVALVPLVTIAFRLRGGMRHSRPDKRWLILACAASLLAIGIHSIVDFNLYVPANMLTLAWILGISAYLGQRRTYVIDDCAMV